MGIPHWIAKTAKEDGESPNVNFSDSTYDKLLGLYNEGKLDNATAQIVEEVEYLRDVMNHTVSQIKDKMAISKEAAPAPEKPMAPAKEVPPPSPSGAPLSKTKLEPRLKEPETTKWKEIRFNKRTGTWQCVITTRLTRNFLSEDAAVEFTKKASLGLSQETNVAE